MPSPRANTVRRWTTFQPVLRLVRHSFSVRGSLGVGGPALRSLGVGGLVPAALLALMPKCALCLLAYAGLGAALGLTGPELCGGPTHPAGSWIWPLAFLALAVVWLTRHHHRRGQSRL